MPLIGVNGVFLAPSGVLLALHDEPLMVFGVFVRLALNGVLLLLRFSLVLFLGVSIGVRGVDWPRVSVPAAGVRAL